MDGRRAVAVLLERDVMHRRARDTGNSIRGKYASIRIRKVDRSEREGANDLVEKNQRVTRPLVAVLRMRGGLEDGDKLEVTFINKTSKLGIRKN